jgi:hypothetical protein
MNNGLLYFPPGPDQLLPAAVLGASRGLILQSHSSTPNTKLNLTADEIILKSEGGLHQLAEAVIASADITVSGIGGRDGFIEAAGTWYYVWAVGNGRDVGTLLSLSTTTPALPAGFEFRALVGAAYNDAGSNLRRMWQADRRAWCVPVAVFGGVGAVAYAALSIATAVPTLARTASGSVSLSRTTAGIITGTLAGDPNDLGAVVVSHYQNVLATVGGYFEVPLWNPQTLYHRYNEISDVKAITIGGYTL